MRDVLGGPDVETVDTISGGEVARMRDVLEDERRLLHRKLGEATAHETRTAGGLWVNAYCAAEVPDWEIRQRLEAIDAVLAESVAISGGEAKRPMGMGHALPPDECTSIAHRAQAERIRMLEAGLLVVPSGRVIPEDVHDRCVEEAERMRQANKLLRGAIAASDERLARAAVKVWGDTGACYSCDTPDDMADELLALRLDLAHTEALLMVSRGREAYYHSGRDEARTERDIEHDVAERLRKRLELVTAAARRMRCAEHSTDASNGWGCPVCVYELRQSRAEWMSAARIHVQTIGQEIRAQLAERDAMVEEAADEMAASVKASLMDAQHDHAHTLETERRLRACLDRIEEQHTPLMLRQPDGTEIPYRSMIAREHCKTCHEAMPCLTLKKIREERARAEGKPAEGGAR
jgi:hypothetical protein